MNQKDLFQHYVADVQSLLEEGANPRALIEVLAAVSVDLALQIAPTPEYAFLAVFEGLRDMSLVHAKRGEKEDSEIASEEEGLESDDEASDDLEMDSVITTDATIH